MRQQKPEKKPRNGVEDIFGRFSCCKWVHDWNLQAGQGVCGCMVERTDIGGVKANIQKVPAATSAFIQRAGDARGAHIV